MCCQVPPWIKLPAFYLLDAISKNVYDPYARQFAPFVTALFLETYAQVDQNTRSKMEEMLMTWRTGGANGKELFGVVPQLSIERGVWGGDSDVSFHKFSYGQDSSFLHRRGSILQPTSSFYSGSGQITKSQVLSELEFVLGQKERTLLVNPFDTASQNHINILQQVCNYTLCFLNFLISYCSCGNLFKPVVYHKKNCAKFWNDSVHFLRVLYPLLVHPLRLPLPYCWLLRHILGRHTHMVIRLNRRTRLWTLNRTFRLTAANPLIRSRLKRTCQHRLLRALLLLRPL